MHSEPAQVQHTDACQAHQPHNIIFKGNSIKDAPKVKFQTEVDLKLLVLIKTANQSYLTFIKGETDHRNCFSY